MLGRLCEVQGHRGCPYLEPENTLAGFKKCVELGIDAVELDVFKTRDGRLVSVSVALDGVLLEKRQFISPNTHLRVSWACF